MRAQPSLTPMHRGLLPACSCRHPLPGVDGPERPSGRNALPSGVTPSTIMSPTRRPAGSWTEIRLGARAHNTRPNARAHAPPANHYSTTSTRTPRLPRRPCTDKEHPDANSRRHSRRMGSSSHRRGPWWGRSGLRYPTPAEPGERRRSQEGRHQSQPGEGRGVDGVGRRLSHVGQRRQVQHPVRKL